MRLSSCISSYISSYISSWIFLRALGIIYFFAFIALAMQIQGLIGTEGILPANEYLTLVSEKLGIRGYSVVPSLYWLWPSNTMLTLLCFMGIFFSLLLAMGILAPLALVILYICYLSLISIGQDFLSFQWDILLLECGFLAIFIAPLRFYHKPNLINFSLTASAFSWLLRWLLFRLLFASGYVKIVSDVTWRNLNALNYHYETQPLPNLLAWYAHQLPTWFQKFSVAGMLGIELILPFLFFAPRRLRNITCIAQILLQSLVILTGNYGFFNLLTITLCILLIDDSSWKKLFNSHPLLQKFISIHFHSLPKLQTSQSENTPLITRKFHYDLPKFFLLSIAIILFLISSLRFSAQLLSPSSYSHFVQKKLSPLAPFHIANTYGLFATMTKSRPEIVIEGSNDGILWHNYRFPWKIENLRSTPQQVAPYQARLDWQMWFAALRGNCRNAPWFLSFLIKLLQNKNDTVKLLEHNPFPHKGPRYIQALLYEYRFTNFSEKQREGKWWKRRKLGFYCPPFGL